MRVVEGQVEGMRSTKCWSRFLKSIAVVVAVSLVSVPTGVMAQSTAQISGVVTDQSSEILPGVEVKVTQTDTGITSSAVTNETGSYVCQNLLLGPGSRNYPTIIIQVAGGMQAGLTYRLDGTNHNDAYNNLNLPLPFPDALQEFKVETSGLAAQYGFHSSGAVNAVTKAGTNEYH